MSRVIDLSAKFASFTETWSPKIVGRVDEMDVKIARIDGAFDWHAHADADEMFFVVEGEMVMHFRDGSERVAPGQMIIVPKGVEHRPESLGGECKILMVEQAGTLNTGDRPESAFTVENPEEI